MENDNYKHSDITEKIIKAFYKVYNTLGYGFLENVYENAMHIELKELGYSVTKQEAIKVYFNERIVGSYFADLCVESKVIIELKATENPCEEVGLLLNFGRKPEVKRKVYSNFTNY